MVNYHYSIVYHLSHIIYMKGEAIGGKTIKANAKDNDIVVTI